MWWVDCDDLTMWRVDVNRWQRREEIDGRLDRHLTNWLYSWLYNGLYRVNRVFRSKCLYYMLKSFYYKNQLLNSKNWSFWLLNFLASLSLPAFVISGLWKMHMTSVVVMKNEYTHVFTKRPKGLNFLLHAPHVKMMQNFKATCLHFHWIKVGQHVIAWLVT